MTEAITGQIAVVGRSGAIVAMSTGLVASVAVPAHALASSSSSVSASAPRTNVAVANTAASSTRTAHSLAGRSSVTLGSANLAQGTMVSAPNTAIVTFDAAAFKAAPVKKASPTPSKASSTPSASPTPSRASRAVSRAVSSRAKAPRAKRSSAPAQSGSSIISIASRYVGIPYVYGGTTPRGFDCSGFTGYVYRQTGVSLPRTANDQMNATKRISRSEARPGDLVFIVSGGRAYHSGIYAGKNMMYDSPRSGKTLQKREIWSAAVVFTRA